MLIEELWNEWLEGLRSESTFNTYRTAAGILLRTCSGLPVEDLTSQHLQEVVQTIDTEINSQNSRRTYKVALRSFLQWATDQHHISPQSLPVLMDSLTLQKPQRTQRPKIVVPHWGIRDLLAVTRMPRDRLVLLLAIALPCRPREIIGINCGRDIDRQKHSIQLGYAEDSQLIEFENPQSETWQLILHLSEGKSSSDFLIRGVRGRAISEPQLIKIIQEAIDRAGIEAQARDICTSQRKKEIIYCLL